MSSALSAASAILRRALYASYVTVLAFDGSAAFAQDEIEEVIVVAEVTGSHIARETVLSSPLKQYDVADLREIGVNDFRDLVEILPINAGAENNSDNLTQNHTGGTANVNLRGLGVASTLVLLNERRQVFSAVQTDDGSSFVDLAGLVPMLAVDHVDILKDGAAAIYGSDAVAGVVNFQTRRGFNGFEMETEYRHRTNDGHQRDFTIDAVYGRSVGSDGQLLLAASWLSRTSLVLSEVDWLEPSTSGFGNPGSFNVPSMGRTLADPGCSRFGGLVQELPNDSTICRYDYGPHITAIPNENRMQVFGRLDGKFDNGFSHWFEFGFAYNDTDRATSPSFPVLSTPTIPIYHPANPYGENVFFQGRPYGNGYPSEINYYQHQTTRIAAGVQGEFSTTSGWDVAFVHGRNDAEIKLRDVNANQFQAALSGLGGPACRTTQTPGEGNCLFFNPFSSHFGAQPGDTLHNAAEIYDFIIGDWIAEGTSTLTTIEASASGRLPNRLINYAVGVQYRSQALDYAYDDVTRQDGWSFLIGNPEYEAEDDVFAGYGELLVPVGSRLEFTAALRYENYGGGVGDTLDPKLAVLIEPRAGVILRGSVSTSFRAPSPFQTNGVQTNFTNIIDYDGSRTFAGRRTVGSPDLRPETSTAINVGITLTDEEKWEIDADYWSFSFEDVLRKENAQEIVNANPFDPRIIRTAAGTIAIVNVAAINADSIDTNGIDVSARRYIPLANGNFVGWADATWNLSYDVSNAGVSIDALGKLNRANVGAPNQKLKGTAGVSWTRSGIASLADSLATSVLVRHVGGYEDDAGGTIGDFTTIDMNLRWIWRNESWNMTNTIMVGLVNAFDVDPPRVNVAATYDPRSADPRGRRVYVSFAMKR